MAPLCLREEEILVWKAQGFPVPYDKRVEGFWTWDTVQDVRVKIAEDLNIVENGNFIRVSTEAAVRGCKFTGKYTQRSHIIVKLQDLS